MWDKSLLLIRRDCSRTFKANEERSEKGTGESDKVREERREKRRGESDEGREMEGVKTEGKRE